MSLTYLLGRYSVGASLFYDVADHILCEKILSFHIQYLVLYYNLFSSLIIFEVKCYRLPQAFGLILGPF